jgi:integrase
MGRGNKGEMKGSELEEFSSVKNWLNSLSQASKSRGKTELTLGAKRQRLGRMLELMEFTKLNPDQLLAEAKENINKAGERLDGFFKDRVKNGIDWNTACTNISFLRGFYTHNDLTFPKRWKLASRKVSKVSKRDAKTPIYDYDETTGEAIFKNGLLQQFVQNLNFRDQTVALSLLSSGADAEDLLQLNVGFIKDGKGELCKRKRFFWHGNRQKDGVEFKTMFSEEATEFIRRYVEQERADAKDNEPLFAKKFDKTVGEENGKRITQPVVERLPVSALAFNFKQASEKMGYKCDFESNPFRPKRFRHLFRTACSNANVEVGFVYAMMGHATPVSQSYLEKTDGLYIQEYVKVEPYLTVFGINKEKVTEMGEEIHTLNKTVEIVTKDVEVLEAKIKDLEVIKQMMQLPDFVFNSQKWRNMIQELWDEQHQKVESEDFDKTQKAKAEIQKELRDKGEL